ncbi:hypothetical protein GCM10027162_75720 [Streptomyces incanus]
MAAAKDAALLGHAEMCQYVTAVVDALRKVGAPPSERWDEARASALYWTEGEPVLAGGPWTRGTVVFWRMTDGWHCAPLDAHGDPERKHAHPLPIAPLAPPGALAEFLLWLFQSGVTPQPGPDMNTEEGRR